MENKFTFGEVMNVCSKTDHTNLKKTAKIVSRLSVQNLRTT